MRRVLIYLFSLLALLIVVPLFLVAYVNMRTDSFRTADIDRVPEMRVAIVFGAAVRPDKTPSAMLRDRIEAGVLLYKTGRVKKLLMTGDNGSPEYNEVAVMKAVAQAQGVPSADIVLDYAGFSTYESCYRAKAIFGVEKAILVTQSYHLPRAIFTCRNLGVEAFGYSLADFSKYPDQRKKLVFREFFATVKAVFETKIYKPDPKYLGNFEGPI